MVLTRAAHAAEVDSIQCLPDEVIVHAHCHLRLDVASLTFPFWCQLGFNRFLPLLAACVVYIKGLFTLFKLRR